MEPSKKFSSSTPSVAVLRWGHRQERDKRLTTHIALASRALGVSHFILADVRDEGVETTVVNVVENWGGSFKFEMGKPWKQVVKDWNAKGGVVVHLTAYGENIEFTDVLSRIRATQKDVLVIVGSKKVPPEFFSERVSDFNVAIGNQPHSECSSLAVFLDRFFHGQELCLDFEGAKTRIIPQAHGKKTVKL
jgi:tRNA (cytidine56-2'-O)-methyltransferase